MVGNVLANPSMFNAAVAAVAIACLFPRILAEERLMGDSYKTYAERVRWRFLPGVSDSLLALRPTSSAPPLDHNRAVQFQHVS